MKVLEIFVSSVTKPEPVAVHRGTGMSKGTECLTEVSIHV